MKLAGVLSIVTGMFLLAGHGQVAALVSLVRHALRVLVIG